MSDVVQGIKRSVRTFMRGIAAALHRISGGRVSPNMITWLGLLLHGLVAYCIVVDQWLLAAVMLVVFGLFDTLDGELARLQGSVSDRGGFLDASTDRIKEVILYSAVAYVFATSAHPATAVVAVIAVGMSLSVSYVKAKGEAIVATKKHSMTYPTLNRLFGGGLFPFEIRMLVLVLGLATGYLVVATAIVAIGATITTFERLYRIQGEL